MQAAIRSRVGSELSRTCWRTPLIVSYPYCTKERIQIMHASHRLTSSRYQQLSQMPFVHSVPLLRSEVDYRLEVICRESLKIASILFRSTVASGTYAGDAEQKRYDKEDRRVRAYALAPEPNGIRACHLLTRGLTWMITRHLALMDEAKQSWSLTSVVSV
jgi:hypothetical protein